jgi:hypothetical protein
MAISTTTRVKGNALVHDMRRGTSFSPKYRLA